MTEFKRYLVVLCILSFVFFELLALMWYGYYAVPFGMSDVDRYMEWFNDGDVDFRGLLTHSVILYVFNLPILWVFFPALVCFIVLPYGCYRFYHTILPYRDSLWAVFFFCFGTFAPLMFFFTALWSQMLAFTVAVYAFAFYYEGKLKLGFLGMFLSVVIHPFMLVFWVLVLLAANKLDYRRYVPFLLLVVIVAVSLGLHKFLVFFSDYPLKEPNLYTMFFVYTCPIIWVYAFLVKHHNRLYWILFALMPFVHLGRGMPFLHLILCVYVAKGFRRVKSAQQTCLVLFIIFSWFQYFMYFMLQNMFTELSWRGLSPVWFLMLFK